MCGGGGELRLRIELDHSPYFPNVLRIPAVRETSVQKNYFLVKEVNKRETCTGYVLYRREKRCIIGHGNVTEKSETASSVKTGKEILEAELEQNEVYRKS